MTLIRDNSLNYAMMTKFCKICMQHYAEMSLCLFCLDFQICYCLNSNSIAFKTYHLHLKVKMLNSSTLDFKKCFIRNFMLVSILEIQDWRLSKNMKDF